MGHRDDERPIDDPHFATALWQRMRWAGCWSSARGWPDGGHVAFQNEQTRLDALDLEPAEKTRRLVAWLEQHGDPAAVAQDIATATDTVRRYDLGGQPPPPFRRLRAVSSRRAGGTDVRPSG